MHLNSLNRDMSKPRGGEVGAYKVQAYPREWGRQEGTSPKVSPPQQNSLKQGIQSSHLLRDLSQVVRRTPWDTPVPLYTRTSPLPINLRWHGRFATQFARIDSRESFEIETPIFIARQADSHESLDFPIRGNRANRFARITPLRFKPFRSHRSLFAQLSFWLCAWGFALVLKGFPSERRIYESTLVGQTKLLS